MAKSTVLEIRINSVQDAKSATQNSGKVAAKMKKEGFTHLQVWVAKEVQNEAMPLLAGAFKAKTAIKIISPKDTVLYVLPPFQER